MKSLGNLRWILVVTSTTVVVIALAYRPRVAEAQGGPQLPTATVPPSQQCSVGAGVSAPLRRGPTCAACAQPPPTTPPDENKTKKDKVTTPGAQATTEGGGSTGKAVITRYAGGGGRDVVDTGASADAYMAAPGDGCLDAHGGGFMCGIDISVGGGGSPLCNGMPAGMDGAPPPMPPVGDDDMVVDPTKPEPDPDPPAPT